MSKTIKEILSGMEVSVKNIEDDIKEIKENYVTQAEFKPYRRGFWIVVTAVAGSIITSYKFITKQ